MESFNFVLLLILQVSVAEYAEPRHMFETYNNKNPLLRNGLMDYQSYAPNPLFNQQVDSTYLNGAGIYNGFPQPGSVPGQFPNTDYQAQMAVIPNLDNILHQHVSDWRILQTIVNSFFDSVTKFVESFLSSPTIFGGNSRNSIINPANIDALNEIYMSFKYAALGALKVISNSVQSLKFIVQFYANHGSINITDIIGHLIKGFFKFWIFR